MGFVDDFVDDAGVEVGIDGANMQHRFDVVEGEDVLLAHGGEGGEQAVLEGEEFEEKHV